MNLNNKFQKAFWLQFILIISIILNTTNNTFGCDICGCSVGGSYMGILPQFQNNFAGIRYQQRSFRSEHLTLFPGEQALVTKEKFYTTELWGRYVPHQKIHLFAFAPYNYYTKDEGQIHSVVSGLGDISLIANYIVFNNGNIDSIAWKQALQIGTGIKLPTGKSNNIQQHSGLLIPSLQAGTGSFDFPVNLIYTIRKERLGANLEANYRINTSNIRGYRFGDRVSSSLRLFYWQYINNVSLLPHTGINYEYAFIDSNNGIIEEYTGGKGFWWSTGLDFYYKRIVFNLNAQVPIYQYIAQGQVVSNPRINAGLSFLIN